MVNVMVSLSLDALVDRIVCLRSAYMPAADPARLTDLRRQTDSLQTALEQALPSDLILPDLVDRCVQSCRDLRDLEIDLHASARRSDFGPGFIALTRTYLALLEERNAIGAEITAYLSAHPELQFDAHKSRQTH